MKREWLIKARKDKNMTHDEVAAVAGIDRSSYTRYESGIRTPKPDVAAKIAGLLNFNEGNFFWPVSTETEHENCLPSMKQTG